MAKPASPLARLLDLPHLARIVPQLAPETLHQLIRHSGLDACGEIVALATPAQLTSVLDLDLWQGAQPGQDERFDADRFGDWLELLADTGAAVAARTVAALDESLVIAGLSRYVRVFDPATFEPTEATDDEPIDIDATPQGGPECEVGGYLVRAARADTWDAIVALLLALEADHHDRFHAVMRGVRRLSNSMPELDGLDDLLLAPEQHFHDVALDREERRSEQGYCTPASARAFLQMAREGRRASHGETSLHPIVAAYFRAAEHEAAPADRIAPEQLRASDSGSTASMAEALDAVVEMLAEAGLVPERPRSLLEGLDPQASRLALIRRLMESVRESDAGVYLTRGRELAFLANTLVAGCSIQSRSFTPREASEAAVSVCQLGLERTAGLGGTLPATFLVDHDLVSAFEAGWAVLQHEVCLHVADQLLDVLSSLRCGDEIQAELDTLRIELTRQRQSGSPWRARDALDVIALLDVPAWTSLLGLLDECPVIPAALTASLEGRTGSVSATDFDFIATLGQIGLVREFMTRLPDALGSSV